MQSHYRSTVNLLVGICISGLVVGHCTIGLAEERVPWMASNVVGSPEPPKPYRVKHVYPNLQFQSPVELMPLGSTGRLMVLEVGGRLLTFPDRDDCEAADVALDLKAQGVKVTRAFGFGIHPDFDNNREIFVVYIDNAIDGPDKTKLTRWKVRETDPPTVDPDSEEVLLRWASGGHNGCAIRFDHDGYLYFSAGDGARPYPPDEFDVSQDLSDLRSTICRIDINRRDQAKGYAIPPDNPFIDTPGARPEIWAFGFRNPWRFSIVPGTNRIFCGDVGWELWELLYDVRRGGNYGWSIFEGPQPIRSDIKRGPAEISKPLVAYPHSVGLSITGGLVYRGERFPELRDAYLYGDYVTGLLWGVRTDEVPVIWNPVLAATGLRIISFCETRDREALLLDYAGGIYGLEPNQSDDKQQRAFPTRLSDTGLFQSTEDQTPADGVYEYQPTVQAWQDGATSQFFVGLPGSSTVKTHRMQRNWRNPKGAVYARTLSKAIVLGGNETEQRIETQLLHFDGVNWQPYSYLWNDEQTDAELVPSRGGIKDIAVMRAGKVIDQQWRISNRSECRSCHTPQTGGAVGFSFENLGRYQSKRFVNLRLLNQMPSKNWNVRYMVDPHDESADLDSRARSYLAANCAHCHRRGGGGTAPLDLVYANDNESINALDFAPTQGTFGIADAKVITPGNPYASVLYHRIATSGAGHMPKLWQGDNEAFGIQLIHDWIRSLAEQEMVGIDKGTTEDGLRMFSRLISRDMKDSDRETLIERMTDSENSLHVDLVERFLRPDQRRKRLGKNIDPVAILQLEGNAIHGRSRFFAANTQQCINCHRVHGTGKSVGPDLDGIGKKRTREQLLESILHPSKEIDAKYKMVAIVTASGNVHTGFVLKETNEALVLQPASGEMLRIKKDSIDARRTLQSSIMPDGLAEQMTSQELADLLAFLQSLS